MDAFSLRGPVPPAARPRGWSPTGRHADLLRSGAPIGVEPRYWPVFERATGRVVGADLVLGRSSDARSSGSAVEPFVRRDEVIAAAAAAFSRGRPATARWWLSIPVTRTELASGPHCGALSAFVGPRGSASWVGRLVLRTDPIAVARAALAGAPGCLARWGAVAALEEPSAAALDAVQDHGLPVRVIRVDLRRVAPGSTADLERLRAVVRLAERHRARVVGHHVEQATQLALADAAGIGLVQGYWWGSPGSLAKLRATWDRAA